MADPQSAADVLVVEDLRIEYLRPGGDLCVADGVSFRIRAGEVFGLCGESGSGKSSIAMGLLRLLKAPGAITGGRVLFRGQDLLGLRDAELAAMRGRHISLVPQGAMNALNPLLTVGAQMVDGLRAHEPLSKAAALERAAATLQLLSVEPARLQSYPHQLSGGLRQRVVIAMALAARPDLIVMDEPTSALDPVLQRELCEQLIALRNRLGFSVLFVTHDLALLGALGARIGVLYLGRLVETAPAAELFARPAHPYTQALLRCLPDPRLADGELRGIPGNPADLAALPPGCHFHPRCAAAVGRCRLERPIAIRLGPDHESACHLHA